MFNYTRKTVFVKAFLQIYLYFYVFFGFFMHKRLYRTAFYTFNMHVFIFLFLLCILYKKGTAYAVPFIDIPIYLFSAPLRLPPLRMYPPLTAFTSLTVIIAAGQNCCISSITALRVLRFIIIISI